MTNTRATLRPEWTSTHQCTNVDGWCTDRIPFSIPVPSQVHFFCLPFLSPDLSFFWNFIFSLPPSQFFLFPLSQRSVFFLGNFIFSPPPTQFLFFSCFWNFSRPPTYPTPPPPSIYLPTCHSTFLPINTLNRYLPNPTYMATPTYIVATPIELQQLTMMRKE
jgi:hypothetical protein